MTEAPFDWMERPLRDRLMALYDSEANEARETIGQAIDELDKMNWRPISSAPKDVKQDYLVFNGIRQIAYWDGNEWTDAEGLPVLNISDWMPLPPPPTGEKR